MKVRNKHSLFALLFIFLFTEGCTTVELCYEEEHPHTASLAFTFDWGEYEEDKPEEMFVLLNRIINTKRYVFSVSTTDSTTPDTVVTIPHEMTEDTLRNENEYKVEGGEYSFLAFNKSDHITTSIEQFENNPSEQLHNLSLTLVSFEDSGIEEMYSTAWTDFNPSYRYLRDTEVIFVATTRSNLYNGISKEINLSTTNLTQKIKIRFRVKPEPGITINKIIAEISGVVATIKLLSLKIDESQTYRTCFLPEIVEEENDIFTYEGEINTLGIIPNISGIQMIGPGILHLGIFIENEGKRKVFHERINLINTLTQAQLTLPSEGMEEGLRLNPAVKEKTIEIGSYLNISVDKITSENQGLDKWISEKSNIIDTEA